MRVFARRLIDFETKENRSAGIKTPAAMHVSEKLRPHLAALMGKAGFRALLSRALALAHAEVRWLRTVHIKADGGLEGLEGLHAQLQPAEFFEGGVVLLAQLLGLLVAFIGEDLTLRLVGEIWPKVLLNDLDGVKNEKAK